jgi:hypothetical protein
MPKTTDLAKHSQMARVRGVNFESKLIQKSVRWRGLKHRERRDGTWIFLYVTFSMIVM